MDLLDVHLGIDIRYVMSSLGIRDENLGKFWSRSWDGAKMWMASLVGTPRARAGRRGSRGQPRIHALRVESENRTPEDILVT